MKSGLKSKLILVACFCLFTSVIFAQNRPQRGEGRPQMTTEERVKMQTDRMKENLTLDDKQYESVKELNLKYAKKMEENTERNRETFQKMNEEKNKELKEILTEEQYKKFEEQNANRGRNGRQGNRPEEKKDTNKEKETKKANKS